MKRSTKDKAGQKLRLNKVFDYLKYAGFVKTRTELAEKLKMHKCTLSSAFGSNSDYMSESILIKVANAFPDVLSLQWLLTGVGDMLLPNAPYREGFFNVSPAQPSMPAPQPPAFDFQPSPAPYTDPTPVPQNPILTPQPDTQTLLRIAELERLLKEKELRLGEAEASNRQKDTIIAQMMNVINSMAGIKGA